MGLGYLAERKTRARFYVENQEPGGSELGIRSFRFTRPVRKRTHAADDLER